MPICLKLGHSPQYLSSDESSACVINIRWQCEQHPTNSLSLPHRRQIIVPPPYSMITPLCIRSRIVKTNGELTKAVESITLSVNILPEAIRQVRIHVNATITYITVSMIIPPYNGDWITPVTNNTTVPASSVPMTPQRKPKVYPWKSLGKVISLAITTLPHVGH